MKTMKKVSKSPKMMKKGGSFPDLNKDGKITKADILKGRGVIAKKGIKVKKAQAGDTLPGVTVDSKAEKKKSLKDRIFGTPEERADNKLNRQNNRADRQANRQANREDRRSRRCSGGSCGGRAMGFGGYNKNGGKTKSAPKKMTMKSGGKMNMGGTMKSGGKMTKKCKYGCK
jgi:hypothetical protein